VLIQYYNNLPLFSQSWIQVGSFFFAAWVLSKVIGSMVTCFMEYNPMRERSSRMRPERQKTLNGLLRGIINVTLFSVAGVLSLGQFIDSSTLVWLIGLFGAGFGLSARPIISDIMAGASFVFEDTFAVGEKVEIQGIEGVIESTTLRTTWLRSPSGELFTIPNGDIRTIRNFSRGRFSPANITLKIYAGDLVRAIKILEQLGQDSMDTMPNLIEPWQVINVSGEIGQVTELTLLAKARFGKAAELRTRLMSIVQTQLTSENIEFAN
jgi:small conductance mechanosensitive channel